MRPIAFVLATFVASAPAAAQGWEEYSYPDYAFSVAFPANPQVDTTTYQIADNRSASAAGRSRQSFAAPVSISWAGALRASMIVKHRRKDIFQTRVGLCDASDDWKNNGDKRCPILRTRSSP